MVTIQQKKALLEDEHKFAREILKSLNKGKMTDSELMSIAGDHYERQSHVETIGRKKIDNLEENYLISQIGENYIITTSGKEAYEQVFGEELSDDKNGFPKYLLNGGTSRSNTQ